MQNVIGVVIHVLYGRSRCGSFTRRYSSPITVVRYHVQLVTEKKLSSAAGQLMDPGGAAALTPEPASKYNVEHRQAGIQEERIVGRLALRVDTRENGGQEVVPPGCKDKACRWWSVRSLLLDNWSVYVLV